MGDMLLMSIVAGKIGVEQELVVEPGGRRVKVRGVQVHGKPATEAAAGQRTAINLGGVDVGDVPARLRRHERGRPGVAEEV